MTEESKIKEYCSLKEALEWIAFGWPAFEDRKDRLPYEGKQPYDKKIFAFAEKQLLQAIENRNIEITGIPYERFTFLLAPFVLLCLTISWFLEWLIVRPICLFAKLLKCPLKVSQSFSDEKPDYKIPRLYVPIEYFYKYTFSGLEYCPEPDAYACEIPEKTLKKWRIELRDKEFYSESKAKRFAKRMKLPLPDRTSNRRMIGDKEHVGSLHHSWNEITFRSFGLSKRGLTRIKVPTAQMKILFPLALVSKNNLTFADLMQDGSYTTPYIEIQKEIIRTLSISNNNQPKADAVKSEAENLAKKYNITLSQRDIQAIASFVRLPESRQGKAIKNIVS